MAALVGDHEVARTFGSQASGERFAIVELDEHEKAVEPEKLSYPPVGAIRRGLEILRAVNRHKIATVAEIHAETGFPKPTIVRMLETLIVDGYVVRDTMCGGYRITSKTRELHSGYDGIARVIEAARPWMIVLTEDVRWPAAIGSLVGDRISVQFSTAAISPWSHAITLGMRLDMHYTAMGRAYLAFCAEEECENLLERSRKLAKAGASDGSEARFRRMLAEIRSKGYALRGHRSDDRTSSVAVPIFGSRRELLAVSNVTYYRTAVPAELIEEQLVAPLKRAVRKIEETISRVETIEAAEGDGVVTAAF
jgi:IclR family transcriptional regulator, mhp operon transcriptional activator